MIMHYTYIIVLCCYIIIIILTLPLKYEHIILSYSWWRRRGKKVMTRVNLDFQYVTMCSVCNIMRNNNNIIRKIASYVYSGREEQKRLHFKRII